MNGTLSAGDAEFSGRRNRIKAHFIHGLVVAGVPASRGGDRDFASRLGKNHRLRQGMIRRTTNRTFMTGVSREQPSLLPPRLEDYVGPDNPVRAIDAYVEALDLAKLGFGHPLVRGHGAGQPPSDPADLLKLHLYGYIDRGIRKVSP